MRTFKIQSQQLWNIIQYYWLKSLGYALGLQNLFIFTDTRKLFLQHLPVPQASSLWSTPFSLGFCELGFFRFHIYCWLLDNRGVRGDDLLLSQIFTYNLLYSVSVVSHWKIQPTMDDKVLQCLLLKKVFKWICTVQTHLRANCKWYDIAIIFSVWHFL